MPPPSVVPQKAPAEPVPPQTVVAASHDVSPQPRQSFNSQSLLPSVHTSGSAEGSQVVRSASRMPPTIGSSQYFSQSSLPTSVPSSHSSHISPSHNHVQTIPQSPTALPPPLPPEIGQGNGFHDYHHITPSLHAMNQHLSSVPYPIDASQIDPRLMDVLGLPPVGPQGISLQGNTLNDRPPMSIDDASITQSLRPRRPSGKRAEGEIANAEQNSDATRQDSESGPPSSRKRRSRKANTAGDENTGEPATKKRRSSGSESRSSRGRTRPPSPPPFDPDADPGEELDPTVVTMAALCDDTGRGRISTRAAQIVSNHAAWRAANREKRARMKAVMEAKKYGRDLDEDEESAAQSTAKPQGAVSEETAEPGSASRSATPAANPSATSAQDESNGEGDRRAEGFDYAENLAVSRYNVQVRIGPNGETIIDEDSLFVNRDEEHRTEDYTHVEESDFTKFVNSGTYSRKVRGSRWSAEETELFFDALSQFGENYELISYVLPGRDRKACKNKFKSEDKKNPARITFCLNNRKPYDIATLTRMTGKDFSGPTPEIRAPTPIRSTELEADAPPIAPPSPRVKRKKSRTPSVRDADVEVLGDIDDVEKEDISVHS
ncbi:hypothetical protein BD310DRAFT_808288 [Dichomitus squalens]|uniref:Uncharacterized protein n=1 Tax=Dichomitus squalens TaxID=114155 RepID=A0A4Q9Q9S7_9APHY|nr:hypothetical protein BD310DRAFT_808288 [Dichomitus squalens]